MLAVLKMWVVYSFMALLRATEGCEIMCLLYYILLKRCNIFHTNWGSQSEKFQCIALRNEHLLE